MFNHGLNILSFWGRFTFRCNWFWRWTECCYPWRKRSPGSAEKNGTGFRWRGFWTGNVCSKCKNNQEQLVKQGCLLVRLKFVHLSNLQLTVLCFSYTCFLILMPCNSWGKSKPKRWVVLKIYSSSSIIISLISVIYSQIWYNKNKIWHVQKIYQTHKWMKAIHLTLTCAKIHSMIIYIAFTQLIYLFNMPPVTYFFVNNFAEYITFLKIFSFNFA